MNGIIKSSNAKECYYKLFIFVLTSIQNKNKNKIKTNK